MPVSKVIAIVGVGPALGAAVARRFGREGFAVGLMARTAESLDPVAQELAEAQITAAAVCTDATDPASVDAGMAHVRDRLGPIGVLVYNAGAFEVGGVLDIEPDKFEQCWKVNCMGGFLGARAALPDMLARGRGTILFTGATASRRGSAGFACLAVGKFGLRALAQSLARELGPRGVHVAHVVIDGQIDAPDLRAATPDRPDHTLLSPDAVAEAYWQLHAQDPTAWTLEIDLRPAVEGF